MPNQLERDLSTSPTSGEGWEGNQKRPGKADNLGGDTAFDVDCKT